MNFLFLSVSKIRVSFLTIIFDLHVKIIPLLFLFLFSLLCDMAIWKWLWEANNFWTYLLLGFLPCWYTKKDIHVTWRYEYDYERTTIFGYIRCLGSFLVGIQRKIYMWHGDMNMIMKGQQFLDIFAAWVPSLLIYKERYTCDMAIWKWLWKDNNFWIYLLLGSIPCWYTKNSWIWFWFCTWMCNE